MKKIQLFFILLINTSNLYVANNNEAIKRAIENHDRERVGQLINADNINSELYFFKCSPLHYAIASDDTIALDLIGLGANVNAKNRYNKTPLHFAALYNKSTITQRLLNDGALTSEKDSEGKTPLDIAKEHNHSEIIKLLEDWENTDIKEPELL